MWINTRNLSKNLSWINNRNFSEDATLQRVLVHMNALTEQAPTHHLSLLKSESQTVRLCLYVWIYLYRDLLNKIILECFERFIVTAFEMFSLLLIRKISSRNDIVSVFLWCIKDWSFKVFLLCVCVLLLLFLLLLKPKRREYSWLMS